MTPSDLSGIIYDLRDTVLLVELQGTVVAANLSASRLFRRPSLELVGKPLSALLTDEPETLSAYLRQRSLSIQPANEPMEMKLFQDLALHSTFASFVHCKDSRC